MAKFNEMDVIQESLTILRQWDYLIEMSEVALDKLASDDGLAGKQNIRGKLSPDDDWKLMRIEYLEGPHGEPDYETCDNCGKSIRYVCHLSGDEIVGPDCALSLLKGDDYKAVEDYVGKRRKRVKFLRDILKWLDETSNQFPDQEHTDMWDGLNRVGQNPKFNTMQMSYFNLGVQNASTFMTPASKGGASKRADLIPNIKNFAVRKLFKALLLRKPTELVKALEDAFDDKKKSLKDKSYFIDLKKGGSEFLEDYPKLLDGIGQENLLAANYLALPDA